MLEEYIEKLKPIIMKMFDKESSGHDIGHLERVTKIALYLQEREGGDRIISDEIYEETKNDASAIHHFYHKLLRLGDYMNTKTAKDMSKIKTDFMKKFAQEFLKEWNSEY